MNKKELELEAEKYKNQKGSIPTTELEDAIFKQGFIDGATSKYVEKQKLEFAIEFLEWCNKPCPEDLRQSNVVYVPNGDFYWYNHKKYTSGELFQEFLKTKQ